jgi:hypothetical protein
MMSFVKGRITSASRSVRSRQAGPGSRFVVGNDDWLRYECGRQMSDANSEDVRLRKRASRQYRS